MASNRSQRSNPNLRITIMNRLCVLLSPLALLLSGCPVVTVGSAPGTIPGAGVSVITATVTVKAGGTMVPPPPGTVSFSVDQAGTVAPATVVSGLGTGVATTTFTGAAVTVPTTATITAKYGGGSGTATVLVVPAPVTAAYTPAPGDDVTVDSVVTKTASGWKYVYTVTPGASARVLDRISPSFQHDVTVATSVGTAAGFGVFPGKNWQITNASALSGAITITVTGDFSPGGLATTWDILSYGPGTPPTTSIHATPTTIGPAP